VLLLWVTPAMGLLERFIFYPDSQLIGTPANVGLRYEDVWFTAGDGTRLHGWFVPGRGRETLLWFHGNAGNISHRLENLKLLHDRVGVAVFIFDYRGYGRSAGSPSEDGLYADARAALATVQQRGDVNAERLVYFGRSLGSAVAIELSTTAPPSGLIVETPFTSLRDMAHSVVPGPLYVLLPNRFDNLGKIAHVTPPKLFIHGDRDEIVPYAQGRRLYDAAKPPKAFLTIRGAGHNDTYVVGGERYFSRLREFVGHLP
jgi:fermentation-respiration switch protein FrsA (DUF1100 family)